MFSTKKYRFLRPAGVARFLVGVAALLALAAPALAQSTFQPGEYCTYTQGGWGAVPQGNNPGTILFNGFTTVYGSSGGGVQVGILGHSMTFTGSEAIQNYLPAGGKPKPLGAADLLDPTTTVSGVFGGQVLALELNVDFADKSIIGDASLPAFGDLLIDGIYRVRDVLSAANQALGGGALPSGYTVSNLNDLVSFLNQGFDNCLPSGWAQLHLTAGGPPPVE